MNPRVLFILKKRETYDGWNMSEKKSSGKSFSSGLLNSASFVAGTLAGEGVDVKLVEVIDNNCIDREVTQYKPTHVIVEALWVVPEKFEVLHKLHPTVKWIVRGHSEIPFLAGEGMAIDWLCRYTSFPNVSIASNSVDSVRDIRNVVQTSNPGWYWDEVVDKVAYLPNIYPCQAYTPVTKKDDGYLDVACFGAIRPLKNQLIQAVAAIEFANQTGKTLRFHINGTRPEQSGENVLKNIRALFSYVKNHSLIEHEWMSHPEFLTFLEGMDLGLQVSFSETFNIVAADMVVTGLPIVVSPEVTWSSPLCQAPTTDSKAIVSAMHRVTRWGLKGFIHYLNYRGLKEYCEGSKDVWMKYLSAD